MQFFCIAGNTELTVREEAGVVDVNNDSDLCKLLKGLSSLMVAAALITFVLPLVILLCSKSTTVGEAAELLGFFAFIVAAIYACVNMGLFFLHAEDIFQIDKADQLMVKMRALASILAPSFVLIVVATGFRILILVRGESFHLIDEWPLLVILPGGLVAAALLMLDKMLIKAWNDQLLKLDWVPFATEAYKLDLGVLCSFGAAGAFVFVASFRADPTQPADLRHVIAGLEAALLTVSTVAFSFDSGGLRPKKLPDDLTGCDPQPGGANPSTGEAINVA